MKNYTIVLKNSIIDVADKVVYLKNGNEVCRYVLAFLKESTRSLKLHIDGADFYANYKRWKKSIAEIS